MPVASETMPLKCQCPGCGATSVPRPWILPAQPVVLNYRYASAEAAAAVPRRDMHLVECPACGLIYNSSLDESLIPYDENYDNRQSFSPAFAEHLQNTANHLAAHHPIRGTTTLEVGCGKGDFLKLMCRVTGGAGLGFDSSCETEGPGEDRTYFHRRYATEKDVPAKVGAILCRHVVEHVGEIGGFLSLLHRMAVAGQADVTYVETPVWEWIVEQNAFWDVFHEHCNYFPAATLEHLARRAGFIVLDHRLVFGGQYQALFLAPGGGSSAPTEPLGPSPSLIDFAAKFQTSIQTLRSRVLEHNHPGGWAIWGAGAKGVSLANHLSDLAPAFVVDANPGKWGMFIPGTRIPVVAPAPQHLAKPGLILIANPNYLPEIRATLAQMGLTPALLPA